MILARLEILCSAHGVATALARLHAGRLRHVAAWRRWMAWDGRCWRADDSLLAHDLARQVSHEMAQGLVTLCTDKLDARVGARSIARLESAAMPGRAVRLAAGDRKLASVPGQWDADPDLLNTPAGIVDTRNGAVEPHRADAYMTRITSAAPALPGTPAPSWGTLLERMTGGDADLQLYLQRVAGRALVRRGARTGTIGDDPFVSTVAEVLGDIAVAPALREGLDLVRLEDVETDPDLTDRLAEEHAAILRWAIDGCLAWRRIGLAPPATAKRRASAGAIARFLQEDAEASPNSWTSTGALYARWQVRAAANGESAGSHRRFCQTLMSLGFAPKRRHGGERGFVGVKLREAAQASPPNAAPIRPPSPGGRGLGGGGVPTERGHHDRMHDGRLSKTYHAAAETEPSVTTPPPIPLPPLRRELRREGGPNAGVHF